MIPSTREDGGLHIGFKRFESTSEACNPVRFGLRFRSGLGITQRRQRSLPGMTDEQLERRSRHGPVLPKELEEVLWCVMSRRWRRRSGEYLRYPTG